MASHDVDPNAALVQSHPEPHQLPSLNFNEGYQIVMGGPEIEYENTMKEHILLIRALRYEFNFTITRLANSFILGRARLSL